MRRCASVWTQPVCEVLISSEIPSKWGCASSEPTSSAAGAIWTLPAAAVLRFYWGGLCFFRAMRKTPGVKKKPTARARGGCAGDSLGPRPPRGRGSAAGASRRCRSQRPPRRRWGTAGRAASGESTGFAMPVAARIQTAESPHRAFAQ